MTANNVKVYSTFSKCSLFDSGKGKVNVKLSLYLTKHHAMKTYRGVEV